MRYAQKVNSVFQNFNFVEFRNVFLLFNFFISDLILYKLQTKHNQVHNTFDIIYIYIYIVGVKVEGAVGMKVVSVLLGAVAVAGVGSKPTFTKLVHLYFSNICFFWMYLHQQ